MNIALSGLFAAAPGPLSAEACWSAGVVVQPSGEFVGLDAAAARRHYVVNRTPVATALRVLAATTDPEFLHDVVARERRSTLVYAALRHPHVSLPTLVFSYNGHGKVHGRAVRSEHFVEVLIPTTRRHVDAHGLSATVDVLLSLDEGSRFFFGAAVRALTGIGHAPDQLRRLLDAGGFEYAVANLGWDEYSPDGLATVVQHAPISTALAAARRCELDRHAPELLETVYERSLAELAEGPSWRHERTEHTELLVWIAQRPHTDVWSARLVTLNSPRVLDALAQNPHVDASVFRDIPVNRGHSSSGRVAGRLLAHRFGDDPAAFLLAGRLLESFTGTHGELCDLVAASIAPNIQPVN